jgi:hypothetical protein
LPSTKLLLACLSVTSGLSISSPCIKKVSFLLAITIAVRSLETLDNNQIKTAIYIDFLITCTEKKREEIK